ncbi:MAG: sodium:proton antiporter [Paludibacter sp.]|nr:sodium:proton antiporter [Paludibacter sp.]
MRKIVLFSLFLITGLIFSQLLPDMLGASYPDVRKIAGITLSVALSFIMINVGREFELNKKEWRSYSLDYYVAMVTAALPWLMITVYYMFLMPKGMFWDWEAWKENLLLSRFAAPTSAGILFTMLAAVGLKNSWVYKKIQTLAIFDDLDTILLMIPLQILMVGLSWELHIILIVVIALLVLGWKKLNSFDLPQRWYHILFYAVIVVGLSELIYMSSKMVFENGIHIEVLLPAFVMGMIMKNRHSETKSDESASNLISYVFMFLVGVSMPLFIGQLGHLSAGAGVTHPDMTWGEIGFHVLIVTLLSNLGKLYPLVHYRDRTIHERLAISIGMFTRGEVGAGIIFIAIGYNIGGPLLAISVLTLVLNLILTGFFIAIVKNLALKTKVESV